MTGGGNPKPTSSSIVDETTKPKPAEEDQKTKEEIIKKPTLSVYTP